MAASSRPYQSRLLKFLLRQSQRVAERYGRSIRHVKLGAYWGAQVVLYPVYAVFQTTRLASRQLHPDHRTPAPKSGLLWTLKRWISRDQSPDFEALEAAAGAPALTSDRPILQILNLFTRQNSHRLNGRRVNATHRDSTSSPLRPSASLVPLRPPILTTLQSLPSRISGIACQLEDQSLVLIGEQNLVWPGLPPHLQDQLRQQISWVLADYFYRQRQAKRRLRSHLGILPPLTTLPQALPPINGLRQLMGWIQLGPVAIATNLFKEAQLFDALQLQLYRSSNSPFSNSPSSPTPAVGNAPLTPSGADQAAPQPRPVVLPMLIDYQTRLTAITSQWLHASGLTNRLAHIKLPTALQQISAKLLPPSLPWSNPTPQKGLPLKPAADHLPETLIFPPSGATQTPSPDLVPLSAIATPMSPSTLAQANHPAIAIADEADISKSVSPQSVALPTVALPNQLQPNQAPPSPRPGSRDVDTKATLIEYVEHPLEKLLRWIDQLLSKLEAWIDSLFSR